MIGLPGLRGGLRGAKYGGSGELVDKLLCIVHHCAIAATLSRRSTARAIAYGQISAITQFAVGNFAVCAFGCDDKVDWHDAVFLDDANEQNDPDDPDYRQIHANMRRIAGIGGAVALATIRRIISDAVRDELAETADTNSADSLP
jgi:hypothetical protein